MSLKGIDIASYQSDLDLRKADCDFAIVKMSEGVNYVNPAVWHHIAQAREAGKLFGLYHYVNGDSGEIDRFFSLAKAFEGDAVICLDWEQGGNLAWGNEQYLEECIKRTVELVGVPPIVYSSYSCYPWDVADRRNCGRWVAQYANTEVTSYQEHPWNENDTYTCAIRQYSGNGRIAGYGRPVDLNKAYMDKAAWGRYARGGSTLLTCEKALALAVATMKGKYGIGAQRIEALGSHYNQVQDLINVRYASDDNELALYVIAGAFGNGNDRKVMLGDRYRAVQRIVDTLRW